ncbi:hypothetical protein BC834DRAFT_968845 [Gloeopeniophorella convolvens]|nr:hypothetical protein BC834DRAFT_968845 [Gloeopeniophorella convolvens]
MHFTLAASGPVKWNNNQESTLTQDVSPFSPSYDGRPASTLAERVRELYLQCLWLPEAIMPLGQLTGLVQLLARSHAPMPTSSDEVHPLHAALDGVLLSGRWCAHKYNERLPNALLHPPGGDTEAAIMFFALERSAPLGEAARGTLEDKRRWLADIEKREVQIQILLHLLKLALPGPCPSVPVRPAPAPTRAHKRRRVQRSSSDEDDEGIAEPRTVLADRLEGLMDRLALWQMALPDAEAGVDGTKPMRDWTQAFCDDVVQPVFAQTLPEQYKLLRRKLFRIPQWTSEEEDNNDPDDEDVPAAPDTTPPPFAPEPALPRARSNSSLSLSRSRSLSVSLEQDAEARRAETKVRKVLQREVSMSKVFKTRRGEAPEVPPAAAAKLKAASAQSQAHARTPVVLVAGTPQKPKARGSDPRKHGRAA